MSELVAENIHTVGKYKKPARVPAFVTDALTNSQMNGNVSQFFRLKKGKLVYYSESYGRSMKTCSYVVKFEVGIQATHFGKISTFVRLTECDCHILCYCAARYLAIISL